MELNNMLRKELECFVAKANYQQKSCVMFTLDAELRSERYNIYDQKNKIRNQERA